VTKGGYSPAEEALAPADATLGIPVAFPAPAPCRLACSRPPWQTRWVPPWHWDRSLLSL